MSDSGPLIVPIEVQAMVLNSPNVSFTRATMSYRNLGRFQSPSPGAFKNDDVDFAKRARSVRDVNDAAAAADQSLVYVNHGVYLRWVLPNALRHGVADDKGAVEFPLVPDRWLVTRLYRPAGSTAAPELKAWVVESSHASDGTSAYMHPVTGRLMHIGRKVPSSQAQPWKEPGAADGVPLRAVAPANPAFATYQPFNEDVFSIHDDLATQHVAAGTMSYYVVGWYSEPGSDILAGWKPGDDGKGFDRRLAELRWSASKAGTGARATVYQGMVFSVPWEPYAPNVQPPPSPRDGPKPQVAFGNTGVDAVVAFAKAAVEAQPISGLTPQEAADLLEAFQYNLLPMLGEHGAEDMLEQKIRGRWFESGQGGARWVIVDAETAPGAPPPKPLVAGELARQAGLLKSLNDDQAALDETLRRLTGVQRSLFELWWKKGMAKRFSSPPWGVEKPEQLDEAVAGLARDAQGLMAKRDELAGRISKASGEMKLPQTRVLKRVAAPRFWSPADPVVVVSNTAHAMKFYPDEQLACRWPSEVSPSTFKRHEPTMAWDGLPAPAHSLFSECFMLDPANASLPHDAAAQTVAPALVPPAWKEQPWQPLYLDWEIAWYPMPFRPTDNTQRPNWSFNGLDYEFVPGMSVPERKLLQGRSVLTPKPSFELKARLDQFLRENKGTEAARRLEAVEGVVQAVEQWDFLSQTLSGLNTLLSGWRPDPAQTPGAQESAGGLPLAPLIGEATSGPPDPRLNEKPAHEKADQPPPSTFEGMRGGQFYLTSMTVVDVFGQTLDIVTTDSTPHFLLLAADGLRPEHGVDPSIERGRLVELPPRLLQPARLNFRFEGGKNENPILGWLLPNHLDSGLAVYGAGGKPYGELSRPRPSDAPGWRPAPGSPYATLKDFADGEPQLGGVVLSLQAAGAQVFGEFLAAVDETLWTVDVTGNSNDTLLATLVGRPLAVVGARLSLELQTQAWADPEWPYTFKRAKPRFLDYKFAVRLGDIGYRQDGLIGYFADGVYTRFHTVHTPATRSPSGYVAPIGPGNYLELAFAEQGPGAPAALTLIMDPRAGVHAQCGLFPVKEVSLEPRWVDEALAALEATFRTGPVLAATEQVIPKGQTRPETALLLPVPAERRGSWSWVEADGEGHWPESPLAPVSDNASFPETPPALREGLLKLKGGFGK